MKFLPILLASALSATPAFATQGGEGGNTNCNGQGNPNSPCQVQTPPSGGGNGGSATASLENSNENTNINRNTNNAASESSASSRSNSSASTRSSNANSVKITDRNTSIDPREVPIAPFLPGSDTGSIDGVTAPLPTLGLSGFASNGYNGDQDDYGVTLGIRVPLGGGAFRDAAIRRDKFRLIQEAVWLKEKGLLSYDAHPQHYLALYGAAPSPTDRPVKCLSNACQMPVK